MDDVVALDLLGRRILILRILRFSEFFWERERKVEKEEGKTMNKKREDHQRERKKQQRREKRGEEEEEEKKAKKKHR